MPSPRSYACALALACLLFGPASAEPLPHATTSGDPVPAEERTWPLSPRPEVAATFDAPQGPYGSGHRGVDLTGRPGQVVLAAAPGRVAFVGSIGGKPVVAVDHGEVRTTYEPVVGSVEVGAVLAAGNALGTLQTVAGHCFPATCLHWGVREDGTYLDPLTWLGQRPVRLLPLWTEAPELTGPARPLSVSPSAPGGWRPPLDGWIATLVRR